MGQGSFCWSENSTIPSFPIVRASLCSFQYDYNRREPFVAHVQALNRIFERGIHPVVLRLVEHYSCSSFAGHAVGVGVRIPVQRPGISSE